MTEFEGQASFAPDLPTPAAAPPVAPADALDELLGGYEGYSAQEAQAALERDRAVASAAALPAEASATAMPSARVPRAADDTDRWGLWLLWWIPSLLAPPFGGAFAWYALRFTHRRAAMAMFSIGLVVGLAFALVLKQYATPIAAWVVGTSGGSVITLPSHTAVP